MVDQSADSVMGSGVGQKGAASIAPDKVADDGGSFSGAVRSMFDGLAPRYDSFNHWSSMGLDYGWRRATVRALRLGPEDVVLDIATGTGDLAFAIARTAGQAVGCDFAAEMIRRARNKGKRGERAHFHVARAEHLPYPEGSFQGATSGFAMRNVKPILPEVLAEAFRVLSPGGRIGILEFSRPGVAPVRWGHDLYTRVLMPRVGRLITGTTEPFEYLYRSIQEWHTPDAFADCLRQAGFEGVSYRMMGLGTVALHTGHKPRRAG
jgi:demethylmenaquinone methyltransferase/2-methoxy-6-polyprenyl-1,4-benzoquinol methylase